MTVRHTPRRFTSVLIAATFLLLSTLGLSMVTMSAASGVAVVSQDGSEESTGSGGSSEPESDPEPSDSPEPPPPSTEPPTPTSHPSPPPVEESEPSTPSSNEPAGTDTSEPVPTDSTDPTTSNLAQAPELSAEQVAAFNADVADVVALVIAFPGTVSTIVSAAEVLAGEPFFDAISFTPSDPSGLFIDTYSVTFNLFGPDDETCSGAPAFVSNAAESIGVLVGQLDVFHSDDPATMTQPGTYRFVVNYTLTLPQSVAIEGQTACNDPNESVLVLAPPDPGGGGDDDDDEGDDGDEDDSGQDSDDNGSGNSSGRDSDNAALPDTGAADNLNIIGGTGIALTLAGLTIVAATTRRREGTPLA